MVGERKREALAPVVYSSACVTFAAQTHRYVWGSRRSSSPSCFAKVKDKAKMKNKQKNPKKERKPKKKKRGTPWPLLQTPERVGDSGCLGVPSGSPAFCLALQDGTVLVGCGSAHMAETVGTGQGVCHAPHKQGCGWPFRSRPVGLVAHVCPPSGGQMTSFPGLQLSSKPPRSSLFHSFKMPS